MNINADIPCKIRFRYFKGMPLIEIEHEKRYKFQWRTLLCRGNAMDLYFDGEGEQGKATAVADTADELAFIERCTGMPFHTMDKETEYILFVVAKELLIDCVINV
jgi:hypothetical protein